MTKGDFRQTPSGHAKSPHFARLERLRVVTGKTWVQIAEDLAVDRSMLFHVKAGNRSLSPKVIFRLEQAEKAAGINTNALTLVDQGLAPSEIAAELLGEHAQKSGTVTALDVDKGYKEVHLDFRRGVAPASCPSKIRICSPGNATVWRMIGAQGIMDDPTNLLLACLPKKQANVDFLDLLTPACYRRLVEVALGLIFGTARDNKK